MSRPDERATPGAECEKLPLGEAVELFMPTTEGGQLRRSSPWPKADSHEAARRVCGHCPVLPVCLEGALESDGWTFRGGMSPEERAAFGGFRDKDTRKREVYLSRTQVASRLVDSGMDTDAIGDVLTRWRGRLLSDSQLHHTVGDVDVDGDWWDDVVPTATDWAS